MTAPTRAPHNPHREASACGSKCELPISETLGPTKKKDHKKTKAANTLFSLPPLPPPILFLTMERLSASSALRLGTIATLAQGRGRGAGAGQEAPFSVWLLFFITPLNSYHREKREKKNTNPNPWARVSSGVRSVGVNYQTILFYHLGSKTSERVCVTVSEIRFGLGSGLA